MFQGIAYCVDMGVANIGYGLGPGLELLVPLRHLDRYRRLAFRTGCALAVGVPLLPPLLLLVSGAAER